MLFAWVFGLVPKLRRGTGAGTEKVQVEIKEVKKVSTNSKQGIGGGKVEEKYNVIPKPDPDAPKPPEHYVQHPEDKFQTSLGERIHYRSDCKNFYGGLGYSYNTETEEVKEVFIGYAAYRAEIKEGDRIVSLDLEEIRGTPGTNVRIGVIRGKLKFEMTLTRERICNADDPPAPANSSSFPFSIPDFSKGKQSPF